DGHLVRVAILDRGVVGIGREVVGLLAGDDLVGLLARSWLGDAERIGVIDDDAATVVCPVRGVGPARRLDQLVAATCSPVGVRNGWRIRDESAGGVAILGGVRRRPWSCCRV